MPSGGAERLGSGTRGGEAVPAGLDLQQAGGGFVRWQAAMWADSRFAEGLELVPQLSVLT